MFISYNLDRATWKKKPHEMPKRKDGTPYPPAAFYGNKWKVFDAKEWWQLEKIMLNFCCSHNIWHKHDHEHQYDLEQKKKDKNYKIRAQRRGIFWCYADLMIFDFDDGKVTLDHAIDYMFADYMHIIGTTPSHRTKEKGYKDRFRVLCLLDKAITNPIIAKATFTHYVNFFGSDPSGDDLARWFRPCREIVSVNTTGAYLPEVEIPDYVLNPQPDVTIERKRESGRLRRWARIALEEGVAENRQDMAFGIAYEAKLIGWDKEYTFDMIWNSRVPLNKSQKCRDEIRYQVEKGFAWEGRKEDRIG